MDLAYLTSLSLPSAALGALPPKSSKSAIPCMTINLSFSGSLWVSLRYSSIVTSPAAAAGGAGPGPEDSSAAIASCSDFRYRIRRRFSTGVRSLLLKISERLAGTTNDLGSESASSPPEAHMEVLCTALNSRYL